MKQLEFVPGSIRWRFAPALCQLTPSASVIPQISFFRTRPSVNCHIYGSAPTGAFETPQSDIKIVLLLAFNRPSVKLASALKIWTHYLKILCVFPGGTK